MACHCLSDLKKQIKKQDQEMQRIVKEVTVNGACVLLKKEFGDDKMRKNLTKTIQFLIQIMCNNQDDDHSCDDIKEKVKTSNKGVQTSPKEVKTSNKGVQTQTSEEEQKKPLKNEVKVKTSNKGVQASPKEPKPLKEEENKQAESNGEKTKDEICFAYKFDKCSNLNVCQKRHPQKCKKFCDFGHKNFDERGCETKECNLLHPKLCRNSAKRKECPFKICRFQHLSGTKYVSIQEFGSVRSARGYKEPEDRNDVMMKKIDKLIDLITISFQLGGEKKIFNST